MKTLPLQYFITQADSFAGKRAARNIPEFDEENIDEIDQIKSQ